MRHTVHEYQTPEGASGLVVNTPGSSVINLTVRFNSGFQFGDIGSYEVPHIMEHLLATATKRHPGPNAFMIEAQKNGAYINASTSVDANSYVYEFADFELERMLDLIEEQLVEPRFAAKAFTSEVGNVREELTRNTTQHGGMCTVNLLQKTYPWMWLGYEERVKQLPGITLAELKRHYQRTHTAANARWFVAGSFSDDGASIARRMSEIFARLETGTRLVRDTRMGEGLPVPVVTRREIGQLYYRLDWYFGDFTQAQRRALALLRLVLAGGMGSRIYGEARRRGLAYAVGAVAHAEAGNGAFGFTGYVTSDNAKALFELIAREFAAVQAGKLTADELEAAKDLGAGTVKRSTQTPGDLLSWYLDPYDEVGQIRDFDEYLELLRQVSVTDVVAVAGEVTALARTGFSLLGNIDEAGARHYAKILLPE